MSRDPSHDVLLSSAKLIPPCVLSRVFRVLLSIVHRGNGLLSIPFFAISRKYI